MDENYCPAAKDNKLLIFIPAAAATKGKERDRAAWRLIKRQDMPGFSQAPRSVRLFFTWSVRGKK